MFPGMSCSLHLPLTLEEIKMFHEMDRNLYSLLTNDLWRDPFESMRVMALWLWLERSMYNNVVKKILSLPHFLINETADEATTCLNLLMDSNRFNTSPDQTDLSLTQSLLSNKMTLNFFLENQGNAVLGIGKALTDVCLRAMSDLMQQAIERNTARVSAESQIAMSSFVEPGFSRLNISDSFDMINPRFNRAPELVHPDDRTMFVTFSNGYTVPERDIREFFTAIYRDCIESLHMQEVQFGEQSLYARIVFYKPNVIEAVLNGVEKAKFTIKGRHLWMRKFVPKKRCLSPPGTLLTRPDMSGGGSNLGV